MTTRVAAVVASILVVALGLAYGLHLGPWAREAPPDPGPVIATVDGAPIHLAEAAARVESLSSVHGDVREVLGEDWPERVLQTLVDDRILEREARALGVSVTPEDIEVELASVEAMLPEGQDLDAWVASQGMTREELERRVRLQLLGARVYQAVTRDVRVTGAEIRAYYREHRSDYEGVDGSVAPLLQVRRSIRETLLQEAQDRAYAEWLEEARGRTEVVIVLPNWWERL